MLDKFDDNIKKYIIDEIYTIYHFNYSTYHDYMLSKNNHILKHIKVYFNKDTENPYFRLLQDLTLIGNIGDYILIDNITKKEYIINKETYRKINKIKGEE